MSHDLIYDLRPRPQPQPQPRAPFLSAHFHSVLLLPLFHNPLALNKSINQFTLPTTHNPYLQRKSSGPYAEPRIAVSRTPSPVREGPVLLTPSLPVWNS
ncbi:hypothetical protein BGY98DRAFT_239900 [Russula aff. rugulosa BPL654]|nr:hypothetical protein BGY98DRAFT_239900 [Russula aff. rugulosa BPL654]